MHFNQLLAVAAFAATSIHASPVQELDARNLTPEQCSRVKKIVNLLEVHRATPFCSSFLSTKPATSTATSKVTVTATATSGTASTTIVFKPGNPPANVRREANPDSFAAALEQRDPAPAVPPYIKSYATSSISDACSCLITPTPTPITTSITTTTITQTVAPPAVTSTVYPCATPVPTRIPTLPFGKANFAGVGDSQNELYGAGTRGATLEGCCNLCYFELQNCINAYFYDYQGCVVSRPVDPVGTGQGVSDVCPVGRFEGLAYARDTAPPFRSQGTIAGPCGEVYDNL